MYRQYLMETSPDPTIDNVLFMFQTSPYNFIHLGLPPGFSGFRVARSLVCSVFFSIFLGHCSFCLFWFTASD